jgi:hypothetical protein
MIETEDMLSKETLGWRMVMNRRLLRSVMHGVPHKNKADGPLRSRAADTRAGVLIA